LVVGVLNVTPDSFSDGGRFLDVDAAVAQGVRLWDEGVDWLDVGGESTRPGAAPLSVDEEIARVVPVLTALHARLPDATLSIDTRRTAVARAALDAGASVVNDVSACADDGMAALVASRGVRVVLMHSRGDPTTMASLTHYDDLVGEVCAALKARADAVHAAGVPRDHIALDPGLGFAKAPLDNPKLIAALPALAALGYPVLIGASRKRFIGVLTGVDAASDRVHGSIGAAIAAVSRGAHLIRVHDVSATIQAIRTWRACVDA
jgi:dihydropteroate synthase